MPIPQSEIRKHSTEISTRQIQESVRVAKAAQKQTAFLCHSHKDRDLAIGLQGWLHDNGWDVYIDWQDEGMQHNPNIETAKKIQSTIKSRKWFFYLATENSSNSKWCPWEIGYANGVEKTDEIIVIPTSQGFYNYGQEYLDLYKSIESIEGGGYAIFEAARSRGGVRLDRMSR